MYIPCKKKKKRTLTNATQHRAPLLADTNLDWKPIRRGTETLLISFRLNHSFAVQSKAHPQYYIRGLYALHWSVIICATGVFGKTIAGYLDSPLYIYFILCILALVTCFVVALNSQFARPAPRHSSSTQGGCAVNDLLFKMATLSSVDSSVLAKTHSRTD